MRIAPIVACLAGLALGPGAALGAQATDAPVIQGRVIDAVNRTPIAGALAELQDGQGALVRQTFTSPSGAFRFVVPAGQHYQLRIAAIGFARHAPVDVAVGTGPAVVPDILLTAIAVSLPDLRAMSSRRACGKSQLNPETFGGLLESAQTSLEMMDATLKSAQLGFQTTIIHSLTVRHAQDSTVSADTSAADLHAWPVRALSVDSLKVFGFRRAKTPEEGSGYFYYGPDMQVLFSDWFLDGHCFSLDKDRSTGDTVIIRFDPAGHPKNTDVSGELVLDRATLTVRRLDFELRNLPDGLPDRSAGGEIRFAERAEGLWVPVAWSIWAPITKSQRLLYRPTFVTSPSRPGSGVRGTGNRGAGAASPPAGVPGSAPPPLVQVVGRDEVRGSLVRIVPLGGA